MKVDKGNVGRATSLAPGQIVLWRRLASGAQRGSPRVTGTTSLVSTSVCGLCKLGQVRPVCYNGPGIRKCQVQILSPLWPCSLPHVGINVNCVLLQASCDSEETPKKSLCICSPSLVTCDITLCDCGLSPQKDISNTQRFSGETRQGQCRAARPREVKVTGRSFSVF